MYCIGIECTNKKYFLLYIKIPKIIKITKSYDYVLNMTFRQLTKNNMDKLENKLKDTKNQYKLINLETNKIMWLNDLTELKQILNLT